MQPEQYQRFFELEEKHWWFAGMRDICLRAIWKFYPEQTGLAILDAGCGTGFSASALAGLGRVTGTDISAKAMEFSGNRKLRLCQADSCKLPFKDASFDLVTAFSLIEHLEDDAAALGELRRVCKSGGRILLTTSAFNFLWSAHDRVNGHKRRYSAAGLKNLVNSRGLAVEKMTYTNFILFPAVWLTIIISNLCKTSQPALIQNYYSLKEPLNKMLRGVLKIESLLLSRWDAPWGVSLLCIAKKN